MKRITRWEDALFLHDVPVLAFDIETDTTPATSGYAAKLGADIGLSYLAEITDIGFYAGPDYPEVAFTDIHKLTGEERSSLHAFIRSALTRPITYVGHNVCFDFRSTGGHFEFELHPDALVWDTQIMQDRLLLVDQLWRKAYRSGLMHEAIRWGLIDEDAMIWYDWMKKQRGTLADLARTLAGLKPDDIAWKFAGGFMPNAFEKKALLMRENYVAMDTRLSFEVYQKQLLHAQTLAIAESAPRKGVRVMKWEKLPERLLEYQQIMRIACNQSIRGLPVDRDLLMKMEADASRRVETLAPQIFYNPDPSDPYPQFLEVFSQIVWYEMALNTVGPDGKTYSAPSGWVNWKKIPLDPEILRGALKFTVQHNSEAEKEAALDKWAQWLTSLDPEDDRNKIKAKLEPEEREARKARKSPKTKQGGETVMTPEEMAAKHRAMLAAVPYIDVQEWVRLQCFPDEPLLYGNFYAFLKSRWLKTYFRSHEVETVHQLINRDHWKPYFLFVVAGWALPTSEELQFNFELSTDRFKAEMEGYQRQNIPVDLQELAIRLNAFSTGTPALDYIFKRLEQMEDDGEDIVSISQQIRALRDLFQAISTRERCQEFLAHSERDGCVHSLIVPGTQTGRGSSSNPNMQNQKMSPKKQDNFTGVFHAPPGYHLMEVDLSNAENCTGAMISGDNNFAMATESGDFHANMARTYYPELWAKAEAEGDHAMLKFLRDESKKATFAIPYGVGARKLSSMVKTDYETAKALMDNRKSNFPLVEEQKQKLIKQCEDRVAAGYTPAYTTLWNGDRVMVDSRAENGHRKIQGYTLWNYQQQGGVAAMVHAAVIQIERHLRENNYKTYVVMDVHDALILAVHVQEYFETNVIQEILQIFCNQVPQRLCHRTKPPIHFVAETCPSNKFKWGRRADGDYPFPMDEFINQWGRWKLPEDILAKPEEKREAPTWKGPVHEGWTLEGEIAEIERMQAAQVASPEKAAMTHQAISPWANMPEIFELLDSTTLALRETQLELSAARKPATIQYTDKEGVQQTTAPLTFAERMQVVDALFHKGHVTLWKEEAAVIQKLLGLRSPLRAVLDQLDRWEKIVPDYVMKDEGQ